MEQAATGEQCYEGWTLYRFPGPQFAGVDPSARRDPRSILLAVPHDERDRVVAVLQQIQSRGSPSADGLVSGARLLLDAARELWTPHETEPAPGDGGTP